MRPDPLLASSCKRPALEDYGLVSRFRRNDRGFGSNPRRYQIPKLLAPSGTLSPLLVQDNSEERTVDFEAPIVFDEPKLPELVHKMIDP
jgi:hypothetical protein